MANYPESVLKYLRKNAGYQAGDKSRDAELQKLSPIRAFDIIVGWRIGAGWGWGAKLVYWAKMCGVTLADDGKDAQIAELTERLAVAEGNVAILRQEANEAHRQSVATYRAARDAIKKNDLGIFESHIKAVGKDVKL